VDTKTPQTMLETFPQAQQKLTIGSLDDSTTVNAQYNPKELQIEQPIGWKKPEAANKTGKQSGKAAKKNPLELEFTGAEARTITVELLFDSAEGAGSPRYEKIEKKIEDLVKLATVIKDDSKKETERRPHHCTVVWGTTLKNFNCVIESLTTKYTMFDREGNPLRATCIVKLKEAQVKK
jgi:hypothetical protein